ncbi:hypothetical protein TNCV_1479031 [Trichonephila clavipes]|nr:hypothetical protein TNCV_1479031 [Trichonephila clavipes]
MYSACAAWGHSKKASNDISSLEVGGRGQEVGVLWPPPVYSPSKLRILPRIKSNRHSRDRLTDRLRAAVNFLHHENSLTMAGIEPATLGAEGQRQIYKKEYQDSLLRSPSQRT